MAKLICHYFSHVATTYANMGKIVPCQFVAHRRLQIFLYFFHTFFNFNMNFLLWDITHPLIIVQQQFLVFQEGINYGKRNWQFATCARMFFDDFFCTNVLKLQFLDNLTIMTHSGIYGYIGSENCCQVHILCIF